MREPATLETRSLARPRLAGAPEASVVEEFRRLDVAPMREDSRTQGTEPKAAATQRGWNVAGTIPTETDEIGGAEAEGGRRVGAEPLVVIDPIRQPFVQVAHHVERAPTRLALRARAGAHGTR